MTYMKHLYTFYIIRQSTSFSDEVDDDRDHCAVDHHKELLGNEKTSFTEPIGIAIKRRQSDQAVTK